MISFLLCSYKVNRKTVILGQVTLCIVYGCTAFTWHPSSLYIERNVTTLISHSIEYWGRSTSHTYDDNAMIVNYMNIMLNLFISSMNSMSLWDSQLEIVNLSTHSSKASNLLFCNTLNWPFLLLLCISWRQSVWGGTAESDYSILIVKESLGCPGGSGRT